MKIAFFCAPSLLSGAGAEQYMINIAKLIHNENPKYTVEIVTLNTNFMVFLSKVLNIVYSFDFFSKLKFRHTRDEVNSMISPIPWKEISTRNIGLLNDYDIIYTKNEIIDLFFLKIAKLSKNIKVIVGVHTPIYYPHPENLFGKLHNFIYTSFIYKWLIEKNWILHTSNSQDLKCLKEYKNVYIPYPFNFKLNSNSIVKREIKNVGFTGRISIQKGIRVLVSTLETVAPKFPKINFYIYGSGEKWLENSLQELSNKCLNIKYDGHVSHPKLLTKLKKIDLLLAPSMWEVLPFSVLEAQSLGIPVVSFNIPGPKDIVINHQTGELVNSEIEFQKTSQKLLKGGYVAYDRQSYNKQKQFFDPKKVNKQILKLFQ